MKIAMVCGSAGDERCGIGDYTFELVQHLALDAVVHLYFNRHHGPKAPHYSRLTTLKLIPVSSFSLFVINGIAKQLQNEGYDIIHLQYPSKGFGNATGPAFLPQKLAGMESRSRIALTLHEWTTSHPLRKMVMDQMLPSIDALVVSTEREMKVLTGKLGGRTVMVVPVGNVLRSRPELDAVWLESEGKPVPQFTPLAGPSMREPLSIFHYGLPASNKGFDRLLKAIKLTRDAGQEATLYLGGEFPPGQRLTENLLALITELELSDAVIRLGHISRAELQATAERCLVGVFPFDEGFSSKRSSLASICHCELPLVVGAGSDEEHPFLAPEQNTAAALSVLLVELFSGKLEEIWEEQVKAQRLFASHFSFSSIAQSHLQLYQRLRSIDV